MSYIFERLYMEKIGRNRLILNRIILSTFSLSTISDIYIISGIFYLIPYNPLFCRIIEQLCEKIF